MARREYKGAAGPLNVAGAITAGTLAIPTTGDVTGWPTGASNPFYVEIDRGVAGKAEKVLVTSRTGNTLNVSARGADGTTGISHSDGAVVEHVLDSITLDEANAHVNDTTRDDHTQYLDIARHDVTARHLLGTQVPAGTPGTSTPGDTASQGVATSAARSDHKHARADSYGAVGDLVAEAIGSAASAGTSAKTARVDHRHAMPAAAVPSGAHSFGDANAQGSAATVALSDHVHALPSTLGLTQVQDGTYSDSAALVGGTSMILQTKTIVTTKTQLILIAVTFSVRSAAVNAFAGYSRILMNSGTMFDGERRFHKYDGTLANIPMYGSWFTITTQPAGTYQFDLQVDNDLAGPDLVFADRDLNVYTLGG